jgi:hypothetical protein
MWSQPRSVSNSLQISCFRADTDSVGNRRVRAGPVSRRLIVFAALASILACAPASPSQDAVVGKWKVEWTCGLEALDLRPDGTYVYTMDFAAGGRATDSGRWRISAKTERLVGAHVILLNALDPCSAFGEKAVQPARRDRELETIWEWGRMILSFNPDIQGFTRS